MRPLFAVIASCLFATAVWAAAPPARTPPQWLKLIDQLGDDEARGLAEKKLTTLGEGVLPILRRAAKTHADVDVRLRAGVLARGIERSLWQEIRTFRGHADPVCTLALSPDGKRMVSGSWGDGTERSARVWDLATGKELFRLEGHKDSVGAVAWSPDGKRILTGSADREVKLWDSANGKLLKTLGEHSATICGVAFSADGRKSISCASEGSVRIWDLASGKQTAEEADFSWTARAAAVRPGGRHVATADADGNVRLVGLPSGKSVRVMDRGHRSRHGTTAVAFSPDGKRLFSCGGDHVVRMHDPETGDQLKRFVGHTLPVHALAVSSDGKRLVSGGLDRTVRVWDVESGKEVACYDDAHDAVIVCAAFVPGDDRRVVTGGYDRTMKLWKLPR